MISRVRETEQQKQDRKVAEWSRTVQAARLEMRWSQQLQAIEEALDAHFAAEPDWDAEELAYMAARAA
jgi:hypothetical protein